MDQGTTTEPRPRGSRRHHQQAGHHSHDHVINTYRLRITDLPGRFAREAPGAATLLAHLLLQHLRVDVSEPLAQWKWTKADATRAYAFVEVDDEFDGDTIINQAHRIVLDDIPIRAERCTDSRTPPA
jgi:hypothetical protein